MATWPMSTVDLDHGQEGKCSDADMSQEGAYLYNSQTPSLSSMVRKLLNQAFHICSANKKKHISTVCRKAGQRLGALRKVANKLDVKGKATVYKAQVRSVMEYACLSLMNASDSVLAQLDSIQTRLSESLV